MVLPPVDRRIRCGRQRPRDRFLRLQLTEAATMMPTHPRAGAQSTCRATHPIGLQRAKNHCSSASISARRPVSVPRRCASANRCALRSDRSAACRKRHSCAQHEAVRCGASRATKAPGRVDPIETHLHLRSNDNDEFARTCLAMAVQTCFLHALCKTELKTRVSVEPLRSPAELPPVVA